MVSIGGHYAENTKAELRRNLKRLENELKELYTEEQTTSYNPAKLTPEDMLVFVGHQKERKLKAKTILHNLNSLDKLLTFADNNAVQQFKVKYRSNVPRHFNHRQGSLTQTEYEMLLRFAEDLEEHDWEKLRACSLVILSIAAGLRHKELQFAERGFLDLEKRTIFIHRVKGEDSYGEEKEVPIRSDAILILSRYVQLRDVILSIKGKTDNSYLFPALFPTSPGYFSHNGIQGMKELVQKETGITFNLRTCRRTFGQLAVNEGLPIETVSVLMGHRTTVTTENFYCRERDKDAIEQARKLWDDVQEPTGKEPEQTDGQSEQLFSKPNPGNQSGEKRNRWEMTGYV